MLSLFVFLFLNLMSYLERLIIDPNCISGNNFLEYGRDKEMKLKSWKLHSLYVADGWDAWWNCLSAKCYIIHAVWKLIFQHTVAAPSAASGPDQINRQLVSSFSDVMFHLLSHSHLQLRQEGDQN